MEQSDRREERGGADAYIESNRGLWDERTRVHVSSDFYDVASFKDGSRTNRLRPYEMEEVGDVRGKDLLHVQCHFGLDTLSWAQLGATVTGIDFSAESIGEARRLAAEVGLDATFVQSDVYDLPNNLTGDFDIVYTSRGVLGWLPDIGEWARVLARFVRPGGFLYVTEVHPVLQAFDDEVELGELKLRYRYWSGDVIRMPVEGSYADPSAEFATTHEHGWNHSLGEIVTAVATAGLHIEHLHEFPFLEWPSPLLEEQEDGTWRLPGELDEKLPLFFSLKATKPEL
ncbi:MAG: class I SAM-dependent methyltransferase [Actinomycetota bacterium]|nr:class I SAM-dependent methyltransferase [Actinomycetota bacterium]